MTPHAQDSRKQNIKTMARTQALDSSGTNKICVQGANKKSNGARSPESLAQVSSMFAASDSEVQTPAGNPLASIVLVRDLEKASPCDPVPDFCKLLIEVRTWDASTKSFEFDHFGLPNVQVEDLKSASQVAIIASVAGYLATYEVPASLGTSMLARGVVNESFLSKNGFKKLA